MREQRGFTLIELVLVIIIIGVLAAMVVPRFTGRTEQAKVAAARSDIARIEVALDLYELDKGVYPENLEVLLDKEPPGPYLKKGLPKDPWDKAYVFREDSQHNQDYDLYSLGPDGKEGNDDITNWQQ